MLFLGIAQIGPMPVMVPAVIWLYWDGHAGLGTVLLVWTAVVGTMDNFLRPILIRRGADLPLLLIFSGVIGGLFAFGVIGLFVGPVVLAVTYTLLNAWIEASAPAAQPGVRRRPQRSSMTVATMSCKTPARPSAIKQALPHPLTSGSDRMGMVVADDLCAEEAKFAAGAAVAHGSRRRREQPEQESMQSIEIAVEAKCSRSGQSCLTLIERSRGNTAL